MIPTVLLIAFAGGILLPVRPVWVVAASALAWVALILVEGSTDGLTELLGAAALGLLNAIVGFGAALLARSAVKRARQFSSR